MTLHFKLIKTLKRSPGQECSRVNRHNSCNFMIQNSSQREVEMETNHLVETVIRGKSFDVSPAPIDCSRSCTIEIRNYHKYFRLTNPNYYLDSGRCKITPPSIEPKHSEYFAFRKENFSLKGSVGVLTYDFELVGCLPTGTHRGLGSIAQATPIVAAMQKHSNESRLLYLMWSVPMVVDYSHAIGIGPPVTSHYDLFKKMYYGKNTDVSTPKHKEEEGTLQIVKREGSQKKLIHIAGTVYGKPVNVIGTFDTGIHAKWTIEVR